MKHIVQAVTLRWYNACAYYAVTLSQGLQQLGHRVTLIGAEDTPALEKAKAFGIDVNGFPDVNATGPLSIYRLARAYRRFALENDVSLVNVHHGRDHLLWALALSGTGIPLVRTSGNQIPPKNHLVARYLYNKRTSGVIASCNTVRNFYADGFGYSPGQIPVINGGVDTEFFTPDYKGDMTRQDLGIPDDAFVFGIFARYSPDKGHEHFFKAAGQVIQSHPETHFVVAGWNAQLNEADIRSMTSDNGIEENTAFVGRCSDTRGLINLIDCGIISSVRSETVCRIAMEYMSMQKPVVSSDTNVIPEVVRNGETGIVVPSGDADKMASAMKKMLGSREKAHVYGRHGFAVAHEQYSLTAFAEKTLEAYGKLTDNES